jgi:hypothetical protein
MNSVTQFIKQFPCYRNVKLFYFALTKYGAREAAAYLYYRTWVNHRLRRLNTPLDRPVTAEQYTMHLMCSHIDLDQLLWALMSWYRVSSESPQVYIHDDGSFTRQDRHLIARLFPQARVIEYEYATEQARTTWLAEYPLSLAVRNNRADTKPVQLIDPYFVGDKDYVFLVDTDILWFHPPRELLDYMHGDDEVPLFWTGRRQKPFLAKDGQVLVKEDFSQCNGGCIYYKKDHFDVSFLEDYIAKMPPTDPVQRFRNQPPYVYVLSQYGRVVNLPVEKYVNKAKLTDTTVAKHYTGPRREQFWFEGVKTLAAAVFDT